MEKILETSEDFDVDLFDRVIQQFYKGIGGDQRRAEEVLLAFRDHPDSWARVGVILSESKSLNAKLFALQVLEKMVKIRWPLLVEKQQESVREYVVEGMLEHASAGVPEALLVAKGLNQVLKEIIKREWPEKWPGLISDLLKASRGDCVVCKHTFDLIESLADEVFNFPKSMTKVRAESLRQQLVIEFPEIFDLLLSVLETVSRGEIVVPDDLVISGLRLLRRAVPVLSSTCVLHERTVQAVVRYVDTRFTVEAIRTLREILIRDTDESDRSLFLEALRRGFLEVAAFVEKCFGSFSEKHGSSLRAQYNKMAVGDTDVIKEVVLFYTAVYNQAKHLESMGCNTVAPLYPLLDISEIKDSELFRLCSEFWTGLVRDLFLEFPFVPPPVKQPAGLRRTKYADVLARLVRIYLRQMARPQEVLIRENEEGEMVLERLSETDQIVHCNAMKETLFNISGMLSTSLSSFFLAEGQAIPPGKFSRDKVNRFCWTSCAIIGTMPLTAEREYVLGLLKILLDLCSRPENDDGDRAVVVSCVLYLVIHAPKVLKSSWGMLSIVVFKTIEFMKDEYVGAKDMACDSFRTLFMACGPECSVLHDKEKEPLIEKVLRDLPYETAKLAPYQLETVYEGMCYGVEHRAGTLLGYALSDVCAGANETLEGLQRAIAGVRRMRVVCRSVAPSSEFKSAREQAMHRMVPDIQEVYERVSNGPGHLQKARNTLQMEIVGMYTEIVNEFSTEFIQGGGFIATCARIILGPLSSGIFMAAGVDLLAALCPRTVDGAKPLVEAVLGPLAQTVLSNGGGEEELMKAFFRLLNRAARLIPGMNNQQIIEWLVIGAGQTHREVSEGSIEAIASVLKSAAIDTIQGEFFGLLECIIGAGLDKDHEGGKDALIMAISTLVRYSIDETCPSQSQVLEVFGLRLHQTFPHLAPSDIEEFIGRLYQNVNSHTGLSENLDDFQVKIKTI
ncbi:exportin-1 [Nematocida homosporus]|uniref:exportin-1 n=1 Tax=Nematocida homosporus TaxID=1912981 RepID=UPI00222102C8|nr:exportin-1 [Nematocida homosporus]KAI5185609.1 exportin-1 [Nematocida homosporus]